MLLKRHMNHGEPRGCLHSDWHFPYNTRDSNDIMCTLVNPQIKEWALLHFLEWSCISTKRFLKRRAIKLAAHVTTKWQCEFDTPTQKHHHIWTLMLFFLSTPGLILLDPVISHTCTNWVSLPVYLQMLSKVWTSPDAFFFLEKRGTSV